MSSATSIATQASAPRAPATIRPCSTDLGDDTTLPRHPSITDEAPPLVLRSTRNSSKESNRASSLEILWHYRHWSLARERIHYLIYWLDQLEGEVISEIALCNSQTHEGIRTNNHHLLRHFQHWRGGRRHSACVAQLLANFWQGTLRGRQDHVRRRQSSRQPSTTSDWHLRCSAVLRRLRVERRSNGEVDQQPGSGQRHPLWQLLNGGDVVMGESSST
jgi:hypothetical protein